MGCGFSAYSWKFPAYNGVFLFFYLQLTILVFDLQLEFFLLTILASLLTAGTFAYSGKVRLIRALRGCKQRNFTVSKKAPTVSKQASP